MYLSFENQLSFFLFFSCHRLLNFLLFTTGDFHPILLKLGQQKGWVAQNISWGQSPIGYTYDLSGHSIWHFSVLSPEPNRFLLKNIAHLHRPLPWSIWCYLSTQRFQHPSLGVWNIGLSWNWIAPSTRQVQPVWGHKVLFWVYGFTFLASGYEAFRLIHVYFLIKLSIKISCADVCSCHIPVI